jgi:hypothetical protein
MGTKVFRQNNGPVEDCGFVDALLRFIKAFDFFLQRPQLWLVHFQGTAFGNCYQ